MFSKILVPVSARSIETLLPLAIETARKHNAGIIALHVMDNAVRYLATPIDCDLGLVFAALEEHAQAIAARAQTILNAYAGDGEARIVRVPAAGVTVGEAIVAYVAQSEADLVLLGRRKTAWWKVFDEDIAAVILRQCDVAVQIVPAVTCNTSRVGAPATICVAVSPRHAVIKPPALR